MNELEVSKDPLISLGNQPKLEIVHRKANLVTKEDDHSMSHKIIYISGKKRDAPYKGN